MILVIDNYDSFVHNLARYFNLLGQACTVYRNDALSIEAIASLNPSHIVLSPGPCTPDTAGICVDLIQYFSATIPILGVCLGHQAIGQAFGARIVRANKPQHGKSMLIQHQHQSIFKGLKNPLSVGLYHSLAIDPNTMPTCLNALSISPFGDIMALSHRDFPCIGLQFHPESIKTEHGHKLLQNFLKQVP